MPPKKISANLNMHDEVFIMRRKEQLEVYLNKLLTNGDVLSLNSFKMFLQQNPNSSRGGLTKLTLRHSQQGWSTLKNFFSRTIAKHLAPQEPGSEIRNTRTGSEEFKRFTLISKRLKVMAKKLKGLRKLASDSRLLDQGSAYFDLLLNNLDEFRSSSPRMKSLYPNMKPLVLRLVASSNLLFEKGARLEKLKHWLSSAHSDVLEAQRVIANVENLKIDLLRNVYLTDGPHQNHFIPNMGISESVNMLDSNHRLCLNRMIHVNQQLNIFWTEKRKVIQRLQILLKLEYQKFFYHFKGLWKESMEKKDGLGSSVGKWLALAKSVRPEGYQRLEEEGEGGVDFGTKRFTELKMDKSNLAMRLEGDGVGESEQDQGQDQDHGPPQESLEHQYSLSKSKIGETTHHISLQQDQESFKHLSDLYHDKSQNTQQKQPELQISNLNNNVDREESRAELPHDNSLESLDQWKRTLRLKETEGPSFIQQRERGEHTNMRTEHKSPWEQHPNLYQTDHQFPVGVTEAKQRKRDFSKEPGFKSQTDQERENLRIQISNEHSRSGQGERLGALQQSMLSHIPANRDRKLDITMSQRGDTTPAGVNVTNIEITDKEHISISDSNLIHRDLGVDEQETEIQRLQQDRSQSNHEVCELSHNNMTNPSMEISYNVQPNEYSVQPLFNHFKKPAHQRQSRKPQFGESLELSIENDTQYRKADRIHYMDQEYVMQHKPHSFDGPESCGTRSDSEVSDCSNDSESFDLNDFARKARQFHQSKSTEVGGDEDRLELETAQTESTSQLRTEDNAVKLKDLNNMKDERTPVLLGAEPSLLEGESSMSTSSHQINPNVTQSESALMMSLPITESEPSLAGADSERQYFQQMMQKNDMSILKLFDQTQKMMGVNISRTTARVPPESTSLISNFMPKTETVDTVGLQPQKALVGDDESQAIRSRFGVGPGGVISSKDRDGDEGDCRSPRTNFVKRLSDLEHRSNTNGFVEIEVGDIAGEYGGDSEHELDGDLNHLANAKQDPFVYNKDSPDKGRDQQFFKFDRPRLDPDLQQSVNTQLVNSIQRLNNESQSMLKSLNSQRQKGLAFEESVHTRMSKRKVESELDGDRDRGVELGGLGLPRESLDTSHRGAGLSLTSGGGLMLSGTNSGLQNNGWRQPSQHGQDQNELRLRDSVHDSALSSQSLINNSIYFDYRKEVMKNLAVSQSLRWSQAHRATGADHESPVEAEPTQVADGQGVGEKGFGFVNKNKFQNSHATHNTINGDVRDTGNTTLQNRPNDLEPRSDHVADEPQARIDFSLGKDDIEFINQDFGQAMKSVSRRDTRFPQSGIGGELARESRSSTDHLSIEEEPGSQSADNTAVILVGKDFSSEDSGLDSYVSSDSDKIEAEKHEVTQQQPNSVFLKESDRLYEGISRQEDQFRPSSRRDTKHDTQLKTLKTETNENSDPSWNNHDPNYLEDDRYPPHVDHQLISSTPTRPNPTLAPTHNQSVNLGADHRLQNPTAFHKSQKLDHRHDLEDEMDFGIEQRGESYYDNKMPLAMPLSLPMSSSTGLERPVREDTGTRETYRNMWPESTRKSNTYFGKKLAPPRYVDNPEHSDSRTSNAVNKPESWKLRATFVDPADLTESEHDNRYHYEEHTELETNLMESSQDPFPLKPLEFQRRPVLHGSLGHVPGKEIQEQERENETSSKGIFGSVVSMLGSISKSLGFQENPKKEGQKSLLEGREHSERVREARDFDHFETEREAEEENEIMRIEGLDKKVYGREFGEERSGGYEMEWSQVGEPGEGGRREVEERDSEREERSRTRTGERSSSGEGSMGRSKRGGMLGKFGDLD